MPSVNVIKAEESNPGHTLVNDMSMSSIDPNLFIIVLSSKLGERINICICKSFSIGSNDVFWV